MDFRSASSHAEANAIAQAAKLGIVTDGLILYCTTRPYAPCMKLLAQAGVIKVFYELGYDNPEMGWLDGILPMEQFSIGQMEVELAIQMLHPNTSRRRLARTE